MSRFYHVSVMLPDGCQVLNMSSLIPGVAILGSLSSSLKEWIANYYLIRMLIPCRTDVGTYF